MERETVTIHITSAAHLEHFGSHYNPLAGDAVDLPKMQAGMGV